jgi:hypothetical protein
VAREGTAEEWFSGLIPLPFIPLPMQIASPLLHRHGVDFNFPAFAKLGAPVD